jgi:DNA-binding SARP family transcriptional activator/ATP/maltotriose-dependent transcriptional regulator MalT
MQFLVLGPLQVVVAGRPVALPAAKHRALLAALLVHANRVVSSDRLIDALWGEQPPASAVKTLQTYVSQLRRELEPEARPGAWQALQTVDGGYRLQVDRDGLDADRFARLVETGRQALGRGEPAAAASWLREGLALWRGPAYGELAGTSAGQAEAARLEELRLVALEGRVDAELGLGRHAELVGELEELVVTEPFRERLWSQLMLALYRSGRQAEALDAYGRLRGRLVEQLGIDPGPELRGLQERILRQDPSLELAAPAARRRDDRPRLPPVFAVTPPAPLVGRDAELGRLRREWERAKAGERRLVVVAGEAGIGKSRLAAELARLVLADDGEVLVGHADDEAPAPYQPFVEALGQHDGLVEAISRLPEGLRWRLARLLPEAVPGHPALPEPQDQELDRFRLLEAMAALLAELARAAPLLLVLEDLHWADHATLALLLHLARSSVQAPLLVLATCREEGRAASRLLAHTLAELRRHRLAELTTVRALDEAGIDGLVAGYLRQRPPARFTASIGRAADGNPFFVEELLRHLLETGAVDPGSGRWPQTATAERLEVPEAVREVLAQRLARLPAATAELLGVAAVLGREFEFTLLGRITGWDDEPILEGVEAALRAGILSERGASWEASYSFRHALLRQALYATLSLPRRQRLHLRAAEAIQAAGPTDAARVAAVALHLRLAGPLADPAEAVELSLRASEAAEGVYAWDDAVTHLRAAVDLLERAGGPPAERARLAERLGDIMYRAGVDLEEGIGHLERALAGYLAVGDEQAAARARSRLGMHLTTYPGTADIAAALAQFQAAEAVIARRPARRSLGYLYVGMASAATFGLRTDRLEAASRQALELAEALGDDRLAGWAAYQRAWWAFNRGRLAESLALHERVRDTAARLDDVRMGAWAGFGRALLSGIYLADPAAAEAWCSRALALPYLEAFPRQRDNLLDHLGHARGSSGRLDEARRIAEGLDPGTVLERLLLYWSGEWEQAEATWSAARDRDQRAGDRLDGALNAYWLGRVRRLLGAAEAAEAALGDGLAVALEGPQVPAEAMLRAELAILGVETGRLQAARAQLARCQEILRAGEDWCGRAGRVAVAAGLVAAADGRAEEAAAALTAAVSTFRAHALPWEEGEALRLWGRTSRASDRHADAVDLYRRLGAGSRWLAWAAG